MTINTQKEAVEALNILITTETQLNFRGELKQIHDVAELGASQIKIFWKDGTSLPINVSKVGAFLAENKLSLAPKLSARQEREQKRAEMVDDMTDSLYGVFNQLKQKPSKELMEQANSMVSTSGAITNLWKLQLQALKMSQKG
jgi:gas vesicle protein